VKKRTQDIKFSSEKSLGKNLIIDKHKTTNVNILLNRVRLNKKKTIKKKIIFTLIIVSIISALAVFVII